MTIIKHPSLFRFRPLGLFQDLLLCLLFFCLLICFKFFLFLAAPLHLLITCRPIDFNGVEIYARSLVLSIHVRRSISPRFLCFTSFWRGRALINRFNVVFTVNIRGYGRFSWRDFVAWRTPIAVILFWRMIYHLLVRGISVWETSDIARYSAVLIWWSLIFSHSWCSCVWENRKFWRLRISNLFFPFRKLRHS